VDCAHVTLCTGKGFVRGNAVGHEIFPLARNTETPRVLGGLVRPWSVEVLRFDFGEKNQMTSFTT